MDRFDRCASVFGLGAALIAASMMWTMPVRADPNAPQGATAQPSGAGNQPAAGLSTKTVPDLHPKSIVADPCKAQNPPAYCAKK